MNMRKAQWLEKPQSFDEYMLHSVKYTNERCSSLFFTVGEKDKVSLSYRTFGDASCSFVFFHTPHDTIVFKDGRVKISFFGLESEFSAGEDIHSLTMDKDGESIVFSSAEREVLRIKNPAFLTSESLGFVVEGKGGVNLEAW